MNTTFHTIQIIDLDPVYSDGDTGSYAICSCGFTGLIWPTHDAAVADSEDHIAPDVQTPIGKAEQVQNHPESFVVSSWPR